MFAVNRQRSALGAALMFLCVGFGGSAVQAAEPEFIAGLNDVPVMPGLAPLGETLVFDKPTGRIAEAVFTSRSNADAVAKFYAETLPQLGWRAAGRNRFVRDHEELALHLTGNGASTLRIVLQPRK